MRRRTSWVGKDGATAPGRDHDARSERLEVQRSQVEKASGFGVRGIEQLEPAVEQQPVYAVGAGPTTDRIGCLEHGHIQAMAGESAGSSQPGQPGPDHDDVDPSRQPAHVVRPSGGCVVDFVSRLPAREVVRLGTGSSRRHDRDAGLWITLRALSVVYAKVVT